MRITITSLAIVLLADAYAYAAGQKTPCVCGDQCKCKSGECPGKCPVVAAPGLPLPAPPVKKSPTIAPTPRTAPGAVETPPERRSGRTSDSGAIGVVSGFTPPGYAPAPPGFIWKANQTGSDGKVYPWGLVELPKVNSPVANVPPVKTQQYRMEYRCTGTKCEWVQVPVN